MHPDLLKILSSHEQPIDNEQLIAYLTGELNANESQALEARLLEHGISRDALEGLLMLKDKRKLTSLQTELNLGLKEKLNPAPKKKRKTISPSQPALWLLTGLLLAIMVLVWYFVYFLHKS
jgi:anti-sigma factor RsiW